MLTKTGGGYISHKPNIKATYPFIDDGIVKSDVLRILEDSVGIPDYYRWRSRSGCYFCFFQRRDEWIGLAENHPELFERAKQYEKVDPDTGKLFTWVRGMTLDDVYEQRDIASTATEVRQRSEQSWQGKLRLMDADEDSCLICTL